MSPQEERQMTKTPLFTESKLVKDVDDCYFYHTMDLPGYGTVKGTWDLREGYSQYLGNVDFKGKKVLDIGTANGALCFEMERAGASVIGFDLSPEYSWDIIPHPERNIEYLINRKKAQTAKLNNAFWFCHRLLNSKAKLVHGDIYNIPREIGMVDIVNFGAILLHVRDPFLALQTGLRFTREIVIITELIGKDAYIINNNEPLQKLLPDHKTELRHDAWWRLYPGVIINMLGLLGFPNSVVSYHKQKFGTSPTDMYTVVAQRT